MKDDKKNPVEASDTDSDISPAERSLLDESIENSMTRDSLNLKRAQLDNTDEDGTPLNEKGFDNDGSDLDVPGSEDDDTAEEIGEEDEENNNYSQADTE